MRRDYSPGEIHRMHMRILKECQVSELLMELSLREGVYIRNASEFEDPVLNPENGHVQIFDLRNYGRWPNDG